MMFHLKIKKICVISIFFNVCVKMLSLLERNKILLVLLPILHYNVNI